MSYAKVIYPYQTGVVGDLDLQLDDIIEVLEHVDQNWYRARFKDKIGLVPSQFIQCLPNVDLNENQSLYIAHTDYHSTHEEDLQFNRGDLIIVHEQLSNGWLRGSLHFDLPGTTYRPTGIFPNTFVNLVKENLNKTTTTSSQSNLLLSFDSNSIKFVRVLCDIKPNSANELGCFEDEILAVIENPQSIESEWFLVKNRFNRIGRVKRTSVEIIDEKQIDDGERNDLLVIPTVSSTPKNAFDSLQDLIYKEFDELMNSNSIASKGSNREKA